jgi:hypothetical protein
MTSSKRFSKLKSQNSKKKHRSKNQMIVIYDVQTKIRMREILWDEIEKIRHRWYANKSLMIMNQVHLFDTDLKNQLIEHWTLIDVIICWEQHQKMIKKWFIECVWRFSYILYLCTKRKDASRLTRSRNIVT